MKIEILNFNVKENPYNAVTSEKIFKPRRIKDNKGNWRFSDDGIFSERIFGRIGVCTCGETTTPGTWCPQCNCRVVDKEKMPEFYIPCGIPLPHIAANYSQFGKYSQIVEDLMKFKSFLYDGEVIEFDLEKINCESYDRDKVKIGFEAVKELNIGATNKWFKENTIWNISVPHPIFRPIIELNDNKYVIGPINTVLIDLLTKRNQILSFMKFNKDDKLGILAINKKLCEKYEEVLNKIFFDIITGGKKSLLKQEIISQPITGAIRAVITNNFALEEDVILIGKEYIEILFPYVFKKHRGDFVKINEELKSKNYNVLVNRPPTIGQKSVIFMKPRINMDDNYRFVVSTNPIIFDGLGADTDGDVFLVIGLYTEESNEEAEKLKPSKNYINGSDGFIRNKIPEDFMFAYQQLRKNSKAYKEIEKIMNGRDLEDLTRSEYFDIYNIIGANMWDTCNMPTVGDIAEVVEGGNNKKFNAVTEFFGNKNKVIKCLNKMNSKYSEEESNEFITDVISSNTTDISDSGWFYKKLMSSCDDIRIINDDCGSKGTKVKVSNITEDFFNYRIRFSYVLELNDYAVDLYSNFMNKIKNLEYINVRSPKSCLEAPNRGLCKKCAGVIKKNYNENFIPRYFGLFTTLMITEHATQASLDSMNKGKSTNINHVLDRSPKIKHMTWEEVMTFIEEIVNEIGNVGVQARFYEIALISRMYKNNKTNKFSASSFQYSFHHQEDLMGIFAYSPSWKNFIKMIKKRKFEANSIKTQICFDLYTSQKC